MEKKKHFTETDIFRTSSLLSVAAYKKIKNAEFDIKQTYGHSFLNHIRKCNEYAKLSYNELKENNKLKYLFICKCKYEIEMAESNLNDMVGGHFLQGKIKSNESQEIYLNGGSEISKYIGCLMLQINNFKDSIQKNLSKEEIEEVQKTLLYI